MVHLILTGEFYIISYSLSLPSVDLLQSIGSVNQLERMSVRAHKVCPPTHLTRRRRNDSWVRETHSKDMSGGKTTYVSKAPSDKDFGNGKTIQFYKEFGKVFVGLFLGPFAEIVEGESVFVLGLVVAFGQKGPVGSELSEFVHDGAIVRGDKDFGDPSVKLFGNGLVRQSDVILCRG